jgi:hypothetical protein
MFRPGGAVRCLQADRPQRKAHARGDSKTAFCRRSRLGAPDRAQSRGDAGNDHCKASRGRLSDHQAAVKRHLELAGHGYHCSSDYRDVIEVLKGWGVLRSIVSVL